MSRLIKWTLSLLTLAAGASAFAARDKLDVQLTMANPVVSGDVDVAVDVAVTNGTGHAVEVLKWQLPSDRLQGPLFRITKDDGSPAAYVGPLVKRVAPRAKDYLRIEAGATLHYRVELTGAYELGNGRYTVEYASRGRHDNEASLQSSSALVLWTDGRSSKPADSVAPAGDADLAGGITYTGNCTSSQKSSLVSAVNAATNYATAANSYLAATPASTPRYVKWFGAMTTSRWNTAHTHYTNEQTAFTTKPLTLDCSCTDSGTYAYVYPNQPYKIYLCGAFWNAPMTGTDSKGGTLVHEMSHFNVIASTDDWAYGQTAAAALAKSNPTKALDNADSHEYFAENTPFQN